MSSNDPRKAYEKYLGDTVNPETQEFDTNKAKQKALNEKDKLNILLIGATGVGKSTLLNAVFGDDVAKAGVGEPMTQELKKYHIPSKGLTLWDTKGIEAKDYQGTLGQLKTDIQAAIDEALNSDNPELSLPHVAWLCIKETSSRVEERDIELLELMRDNRIPTVVVFTNTQHENTEAFFQAATNVIDEKMGAFVQNRYVRVNSCVYSFMGMSVPTSGLKDLLDKTFQCLPEVKSNSQHHVNNYREALLKAQIVDNQAKLQAMIDGASTKVNYATAAAGAAGAIPIPFSDMFLIAGIQTTMIYQINSEFEVDDELNSITSTLMGILGTTGLAQLGKSLVGSLLKLIPGFGSTAGAAISGTVAAALTKSVGEAYIQVLKSYYNVETGKVEIPAEMSGFLDMFKTAYEQKKLENK